MKKIEKIIKWIDNQSIARSEFERKANLSNGYLANMITSNSEISPKKLKDVLLAYPELENHLEYSENKINSNISSDSIAKVKILLSKINPFIGKWFSGKVEKGEPITEQDIQLIEDAFKEQQRETAALLEESKAIIKEINHMIERKQS